MLELMSSNVQALPNDYPMHQDRTHLVQILHPNLPDALRGYFLYG
jgi:hypothetical protein